MDLENNDLLSDIPIRPVAMADLPFPLSQPLEVRNQNHKTFLASRKVCLHWQHVGMKNTSNDNSSQEYLYLLICDTQHRRHSA
jgi:hypothetical protein